MKIKYRIICIEDGHPKQEETALNYLANKGWHIHTVIPTVIVESKTYTKYIMERNSAENTNESQTK